jgi:hypothetical protein
MRTYAYNDDFMWYAAQSSGYSAAVITSLFLYRQLKDRNMVSGAKVSGAKLGEFQMVNYTNRESIGDASRL